MGALSSVFDLLSRQGRYGEAMQRGIEARQPQGPQMRARSWRSHPLDFVATRAADTLVGRDAPAFAQTQEGVGTLLSLLRGGLEPSGPASPATVAGGIPPASVEGVWTKVYEKLSGMKGADPFRVGAEPTFQLGKQTLSAKILRDSDADFARDTALDYLAKRVRAEDIPDDVIAGGEKEISKRIYNEAYREGLVKLRGEHRRTKDVVYDDMLELDDEGGVTDKLLEVADPQLKTVTQVEAAFDPVQQAAQQAEQAARDAGATSQLSQVLRNIMNPSVRKMLQAHQAGVPTRELAIERYLGGAKPEGALPAWMRQEIRRERKDAMLIAREGSPGMEVAIGKHGASKQWQVLRDDLLSKKTSALDPAVGALPEATRDAVREYLARRVSPKDLTRKYSKRGLTSQSLFDALVRLSQDVPGE
jgi:hypothetical protein